MAREVVRLTKAKAFAQAEAAGPCARSSMNLRTKPRSGPT